MADENASEGVTSPPIEDSPGVESVQSPPPPDDAGCAAAKLKRNQSQKTDIQKIEDRVRRAEKWMIGLTLAIAFFGLCQVIVGTLQWNAMKGQLGEIAKQYPELQKSADAARDSATLTRQQLIATQAAVLTLTAAWEGEDAPAGAYNFRIHLRNDSHAIASNVRGAVQIIKMRSRDGRLLWQSGPFIFNSPQLLPVDPSQTIGIDRDYPLAISETERGELDNSTMTVGVKGLIEYWNGFENAKDPICIVLLHRKIKNKAGKVILNAGNRYLPCGEYTATMESLTKWGEQYR